MERETHNCRN